MARSRRQGGSFRSVLHFSSVVVAGLVLLLSLASCAVMYNGTTQTVPVSSRPDRAEVFVNGVSAGFTPLELELARGREHVVEVRLGSQTRSFTLRSEVQGAMVGLDLVPVAVAGGIGLAGAVVVAVGNTLDPGSSSAAPLALALVGASLVPIGVDFGTGAVYRLDPAEIIAVFE